MHHCIFDYAEDCAAGRTRAFSIRCRQDNRRIATCTLSRDEAGNWHLEAAKGRFNAKPTAETIDFSKRLVAHYNFFHCS